MIESQADEGILIESKKDYPLCSFFLCCQHGAADDSLSTEGLTYYWLKALLCGTEKVSKKEMWGKIEALGAEITPVINSDYSGLHVCVLKKNVHHLLKLLSDILSSPSFLEDDLTLLEQEVYNNHLAIRNDDQSLAHLFFRKIRLEKHKYSIVPQGTLASIKLINTENIKKQHRLMLQRNWFFVGWHGTTLELGQSIIRQYFSYLKFSTPIAEGRSQNLSSTPWKDPFQNTQKSFYVIDKPDRSQVQIYCGYPGITTGYKYLYPALIALDHFSGGYTSKLITELRIRRGLSYSASADNKWAKYNDLFSINTFPNSENVANTIDIISECLTEMHNQGFTQQEFLNSQDKLINQAPFRLESLEKSAWIKFNQKILHWPLSLINDYDDNIRNVSYNQTQKAASELFKTDRLVFIILGTTEVLKEQLKSLDGKKTYLKYDSI